MIDFGFSEGRRAAAIDAYFWAAGAASSSPLQRRTDDLVTTSAEPVVADLRRDVYAHAPASTPPSTIAPASASSSRLTADTTQIKSAFGSSASQALRNLFLLVGVMAPMVYTSPKPSALSSPYR